jgi:hypothetical protein
MIFFFEFIKSLKLKEQIWIVKTMQSQKNWQPKNDQTVSKNSVLENRGDHREIFKRAYNWAR